MSEIKHHQKPGGGAATKTSGSLEDLEIRPFPPCQPGSRQARHSEAWPVLRAPDLRSCGVQVPSCWAEPTSTFPVLSALHGFNSPQTLV